MSVCVNRARAWGEEDSPLLTSVQMTSDGHSITSTVSGEFKLKWKHYITSHCIQNTTHLLLSLSPCFLSTLFHAFHFGVRKYRTVFVCLFVFCRLLDDVINTGQRQEQQEQQQELLSSLETIVLTIFLSIIIIMTVFGNLLVMVALCRDRHLRWACSSVPGCWR